MGPAVSMICFITTVRVLTIVGTRLACRIRAIIVLYSRTTL
jgi:hypothetical protein